MSQRKILFICEAVTASHIFRPFQLAESLSFLGYDVHLATTAPHPFLKSKNGVQLYLIKDGITSKEFSESISKARIPYTEKVIQEYIAQDRHLIESVQPDVAISDFRLSLSLSVHKYKIPHISLNNIPWSPYYPIENVVPDIDVVEKLGPKIGGFLFNLLKGRFEQRILAPFNKFRVQYGLPEFTSIHELYNAGDWVAYLDLAELNKNLVLPDNHRFLGTVPFSFQMDLPNWWDKLDASKPAIYISLGSSGPHHLLPQIVQSLLPLEIQLIVSTAGKDVDLPSNPALFVAPYLPEKEMLKKCQLYISNGGSPSAQLALQLGVPNIALPTNYDQWLYSTYLRNNGLATIVRPSQFSETLFRQQMTSCLLNKTVQARYNKLQESIASGSPRDRLVDIIETILPTNGASQKNEPFDRSVEIK